MDVLLFRVSDEVVLWKQWVSLNLVNGRRHASGFNNPVDLFNSKVGDANVLDLCGKLVFKVNFGMWRRVTTLPVF